MSGLVNIVCQTFDRGSRFRFNRISPQACYLDFPSSRRTHQIIGFIYLSNQVTSLFLAVYSDLILFRRLLFHRKRIHVLV